MSRQREADPAEPIPAPRPWGALERCAVLAGWAVALAVSVPGLEGDDAGGRAASIFMLAAVLLWWPAVVAIVRSDLRDFVIPDGASLTVAVLGLAAAIATPLLQGDGPAVALMAGGAALACGGVAFAVFRLVGLAFHRLGRDPLGFGDVKLAGACAVWLAPGEAALALEIAALAAIAALLLSRRSGALRDTAVPFGAFMAPAAWLVFVLAPALRDAGALPW